MVRVQILVQAVLVVTGGDDGDDDGDGGAVVGAVVGAGARDTDPSSRLHLHSLGLSLAWTPSDYCARDTSFER